MQRGTLQPCGRILRRVVIWGHQWAEDRHEYEEGENYRAHQRRGMATEPAPVDTGSSLPVWVSVLRGGYHLVKWAVRNVVRAQSGAREMPSIAVETPAAAVSKNGTITGPRSMRIVCA